MRSPYISAAKINEGDFIFVVLEKLYALTFTQYGNKHVCAAHKSVYVYRYKDILLMADWGGKVCGGSKNAYTAYDLLLHYYGDSEDGKDRARAFYLDNGGEHEARIIESTPAVKVQRAKPVLEYAQRDSYHWAEARKWLERKTGFSASRELVGLSALKAFSVNEGKWVRFGVDRAGEPNYGLVYECAGTNSMKIRQTGKGVPAQFKNRMHMDRSEGAAPYLFGYDALPATGELLFLLEGETDVLCWLAHGAVPAATTGGALQGIPHALGAELKRRFARVVVMYDADSAGLVGARRMADAHGFELLDAAKIYLSASDVVRETHAAMVATTLPEKAAKGDYKGADLCDMYEAGGGDAVREIIHIATHWHIWGGDGVLRYQFDEYLPASATAMQHLIQSAKAHKVVSLASPAGTGKTTAVSRLVEELGQTIFCVPTVTIAEQQHRALQRAGVHCAPIFGGYQAHDAEMATSSSLVVCTYDALRHIQHLFDSSTLIVDESHQVVSEYGYRHRALDGVMYAIAHASRTLLFSATPNPLLDKFLKAKQLQFAAKKTNKILLTVCAGEANKNVLFEAIVDEKTEARDAGKPQATTIIKMDNLKRLQIFAEYATAAGFTCGIFTSKKDAHKTNANYSQIVENGRFQSAPDFLLCTTILEAGVSILDNVDAIHIFDKYSPHKVVQMATRPRMNGERNKEVRVFIYPRESAAGDGSTDGMSFEQRQAFAERNKSRFEAIHDGEESGGRISSDATFHVNHDKGAYFVNSLSILHEMDKQAPRDAESLADAIRAIDGRFECEIIDAGTRGQSSLSKIAKEKKAKEEQALIDFQTALPRCCEGDLAHFVRQLSYENRKDKTMVAAIKEATTIAPPTRKELERHVEEMGYLQMHAPALLSEDIDRAHLIRGVVFFAPSSGLRGALERTAKLTPTQLRLEQDRAAAKSRKAAIRNKEANGIAKTDGEIVNDFYKRVMRYNYNTQHRGFAPLTAAKVKEMLDKSRIAHGAPATKTANEALRICRIYFEVERTGRGGRELILTKA